MLIITNLLDLICSCFHPHSLQLILVRYAGVVPNLLKRARIIRGWLTVLLTDARPKNPDVRPTVSLIIQKEVQLQINYLSTTLLWY